MARIVYAADLFCGAGGTSHGLFNAAHRLGRRVDLLAINHWKVAVETHQRNYPGARHLTTGLEVVTPSDVISGRKLDILWASPSCTHHSVARGGKPRSNQSRAQPLLILDWLDQLFVKHLLIENVPAFTSWGPLGADGNPLKSQKGVLFRDFLKSLEARRYRYEWKILNCADYGDATTRERFFLQAVRGRKEIRWPEPTHAKYPTGSLRPWKPSRDIIDWNVPGKSIFRRDRPLARNTMRRIEAGIRKYWGEWAEPFIVVLRGTTPGHIENSVFSIDQPLPTLTAGGQHMGLVQPLILPQHGGGVVRPCDQPLPTVTTDGAHALIEPLVISVNNGSITENPNCRVRSMDDPIGTQTGSNTFGLCQPFIISYYGTGLSHSIDEPLPTVTGRDRFGLVQRYGLDILFRMFLPRELAAAHSFPNDYDFAGNQGDIVKQIGNSVPTKMSEALCEVGLSA